MLTKIEVCPRCCGQINDSGEIYGYTGYTEICCIHCGWAEYTYKDVEVFTDFKIYKSGFERIIISSRCPFCRKDKNLYKSKKTRKKDLLRALCENKHVWYFKLKDKQPVLWR
jgi:hypothetical protein